MLDRISRTWLEREKERERELLVNEICWWLFADVDEMFVLLFVCPSELKRMQNRGSLARLG